MGSANKIGVVTVTYNSGDVLADFLKSLWAQTHTNFILYAVDNASTDSTMEGLKACTDSRLHVIANADNRGVAEGNNQGIRLALENGCDHVLLINNDTAFEKDLIEKLLAGMAQYNADMACPKMMYFDEPNRYWAAGGFFQPWMGYRNAHVGAETLDSGQYDEPKWINYAPTCCVLISERVFASIGLMDARYFAYVDDADFMFRAWKAKATLIYLPTCTILHKIGRSTGGPQSQFTVHFATRNRAYFLAKNLGIFKTLPVLLGYVGYYLMRFVSRRDNFAMLKFKLRAFFNGLQMAKSRGLKS